MSGLGESVVCGRRERLFVFWCSALCQAERRRVPHGERPRPYEPPAVPSPRTTADRLGERLAALERVRPILSDAIGAAVTVDETIRVTALGMKIMAAIANRGEL